MTAHESNGLSFRIHQAMANCPHAFGPNVEIQTDRQSVIIRGRVGSWYQKLMAQEALRHIEGVAQIDNQLVVSP